MTLEPCPFCGADGDYLIVWGSTIIGGYYHYVSCQNCGGRGPRATSMSNDQDAEKTEAAAIEKWNERI